MTFPAETTGSSSTAAAATTEAAASGEVSETVPTVEVAEAPEASVSPTVVETTEELTITVINSKLISVAAEEEPNLTLEFGTEAASEPAQTNAVVTSASATPVVAGGTEYTNMLARILVEQGYQPYCSNLLGYASKEITEITATLATTTVTIPTQFVVFANVSTTTEAVLLTASPAAAKAKSTKLRKHDHGNRTSIHTIVEKRQANGVPAGLAYLNPSLVSAACQSIVTPPPSLKSVTVIATATVTEYSESSTTVASSTEVLRSFNTVVVA